MTEPLPEPPVAKFLEPLAAVWALLVVLSVFFLQEYRKGIVSFLHFLEALLAVMYLTQLGKPRIRERVV